MPRFFQLLETHASYFHKEGQLVTYRKGQVFVRPEDENPWVYFLESGLVEISYGFSNGTNRLLSYFFPGTTFAQNGSFFAEDGSGLEYTALEEIKLYRMARKRFFELLEQDIKFNMEYLDLILRNQLLLIERVAFMGEATVEKKVLRLLIGLSKYYSKENGKEYVIEFPVTQETIARLTHATRESISRVLKPLTRAGLIKLSKKELTIIDLSKLKKLLG